jgi:hypothetical protein
MARFDGYAYLFFNVRSLAWMSKVNYSTSTESTGSFQAHSQWEERKKKPSQMESGSFDCRLLPFRDPKQVRREQRTRAEPKTMISTKHSHPQPFAPLFLTTTSKVKHRNFHSRTLRAHYFLLPHARSSRHCATRRQNMAGAYSHPGLTAHPLLPPRSLV